MNRYLGEVARLATQRGVRSEKTEEGLHLKMDGAPLCQAIEDGSFRYRKQDTEDLKRSQMLHDIVNDAGVVKEYVSAMEAAPFLKATGLAEEKFKLLREYSAGAGRLHL